MLRPLLVALVCSAIALAGCSGNSPKVEPSNPGGFVPTEDTGIIQGVIVDAGIRPLQGVTILASGSGDAQTATSDDTGYFGFQDLVPGTWFLSASKLGYDSAQQSVEVVAGDADPPVAKILLLENPELRPYSETHPWAGFIQCAVGIPEVGSVNPCAVSSLVDEEGGSDNVHSVNVSRVPSFVQAEMVWKPATNVGTSFRLMAFVDGELLVEDYAEVTGTSPLILRIDGELLDNKSVGDGQQLNFRVFPGADEPTAFANQVFDVYITIFYGYTPPEGWTFIADGALDPTDA